MSIVDLRGNNLENKFRIGFLIGTPLKSSPNDKIGPSFQMGEMYLLNLAHNS